jgi:hypothetical protein
MRGNWTERRRVLSDGLLALHADLLTLQETIVDNGYDQAADVLDRRYRLIHQQDRETDGQASPPPAGGPSAISSSWTSTSPAAPATSPAPASSPRSSPQTR